jgi:hypothetical protein
MQDMKMLSVTFLEKAYFSGTTFSKGALFHGTNFSKKVDFSGAKFSGEKFYFDLLGKGASFIETTFSKDADFSRVEFSGVVDFRRAEFLGKVDFTSAIFSEARFTFANFSSSENEALFKGTRFKEMADFSYVSFGNVNFNSSRNEKPYYIPSNSQFIPNLDNGKISKGIIEAFVGNQLPLSQEVNVSIIEEGKQWLMTDEKKNHTYTVFKGLPPLDDKLEVYLKERRTVITTGSIK